MHHIGGRSTWLLKCVQGLIFPSHFAAIFLLTSWVPPSDNKPALPVRLYRSEQEQFHFVAAAEGILYVQRRQKMVWRENGQASGGGACNKAPSSGCTTRQAEVSPQEEKKICCHKKCYNTAAVKPQGTQLQEVWCDSFKCVICDWLFMVWKVARRSASTDAKRWRRVWSRASWTPRRTNFGTFLGKFSVGEIDRVQECKTN